VTPYLFLVLNLPPPPLFKDELDRNIIPQVPLATLLNQFDGQSVQVDTRKAVQRSYRIKKLPPYLILIMQRFSKNNWTLEKNPTIINFPIKNVDLSECTPRASPRQKFSTMLMRPNLTLMFVGTVRRSGHGQAARPQRRVTGDAVRPAGQYHARGSSWPGQGRVQDPPAQQSRAQAYGNHVFDRN